MKSMQHVILLTLMAFITAIAAPVHCLGSHGVAAFHACCNAQNCICPASGSVQKHSYPNSDCCIGIHTLALISEARVYNSPLQNVSSVMHASELFKHLEQQIALTGNDSISHVGSGPPLAGIAGVVLRI
jgi:hypothetical protein